MDRSSERAGQEFGRRAGQIASQRDRLLANLVPQGEQEREGIQGGLEARGLFGGGQMAEHVARQRANEGRRSSGIQADAAMQYGDQAAQMAQQQADIDRRRAETRLEYLSRGFV
jgi:hypothetical protein